MPSTRRSRTPFSIMTKPTGPICNLECAYCYYLRKTNLYSESEQFRMSDELLEQFIRDYLAAQPGPDVVISWQGGEPTLMGLDFFRKSVEYAQRYLPKGWRVSYALQTNGTLLDDEWCTFFKEHNFLLGVSVDGPAIVHNHYRRDKGGRPTHDQVLRGLRLLQTHEVDFNILCVVNDENAKHPLEVYRFFKEIGATWIQFIPIVERTSDGGVTARSVAPKDYGAFLSAIFDEWIRHDVGRIFVQIFEECVAVWMGYPPSLCIFTETCGRALVMEHNGDLYSCDHFVEPPYRLGNIRERSLEEMVNSPQQVQFGLNKKDSLPGKCRQCDYYFICHGACPKDRFALTPGDEPGLSYLCAGYYGFFAHVDPYLRRLAAILKEGLPPTTIMQELREKDAVRWSTAKRNDPCPCGSGRKYKRCCWSKHQTA